MFNFAGKLVFFDERTPCTLESVHIVNQPYILILPEFGYVAGFLQVVFVHSS